MESLLVERLQQREARRSLAERAQVLMEKGWRIAVTTRRDYSGSTRQHRLQGCSGSQVISRQSREQIAVKAAIENSAVTFVGAPLQTSVTATLAGV